MKVETIETILVLIIVLIQLWTFIKTYTQIGIYKSIIPEIQALSIRKVNVPLKDVENLTPKEILANLGNYKYNDHKSYQNPRNNADVSEIIPSLVDGYQISSPEEESSFYPSAPKPIFTEESNYSKSDNGFGNLSSSKGIELVEINLIEMEGGSNPIFSKILSSTNHYLIRNRGGATDFNLIKDIVERNSDAIEEDINISLSTPLYLGLMGTMLGIVIGLFNIPSLNLVLDTKSQDLMLNEGISTLIGGVKIAMIGSFVGLLLTIFNSGWRFKGARTFVESNKNEYYSFIQIELLPIINQGLASTLNSLQRNLIVFKDDFGSQLNVLTKTVASLSGIFDSSKEAIKSQKELLDAIDKTKVSEMTRYNVKVLQQLDISVAQFEKFNQHLTNVNLFVENSNQIVNRTNELLNRTENFKNIADSLESRLNQSQKLLEFLSAHFHKLEEHKEFTSNAVADVGHSISETFKELKLHIQNSSEQVKEFTIQEIDLLKNALSESKTNLSNLEHLGTLNKDVSIFKNNSASQGEKLKQQLDELNRNMAKSIAVLEEIEKSSLRYRAKGVSKSIKKLFSK